jgi:HEAT repeat protein
VIGDLLLALFAATVGLSPTLFKVLLRSLAQRGSQRGWMAAAQACGLTAVNRSTWSSGPDARDRPLSVSFDFWSAGDEVRGTLLAVRAPDDAVRLGLVPESAATERAKRRGAREIETGDATFDDEFFVTGPVAAVRAVLDDGTRSILSALRVEVDLEVAQGVLRGRIRNEGRSDDLHGLLLSRTLPLLLAAARRLRRPEDVAAALIHNALADREAGVRRENLLALASEYPEDPRTRETLRRALDDPSDTVRVRAAILLADEGRPTLFQIARSEDAEDAATARAITTLGEHLSADDAGLVLRHALRGRRLDSAAACLARLGRHAGAGAITHLARVLAVEKGDLAIAAARALGATGLAQAEAPLLSSLSRELPDLRAAAAEALGRVGSAAAVLPLKDLEARAKDEAVRRAARQAVAAIQARLPGASAGQLSLAPAEAGALSLAEEAGGRLSLASADKRTP